MKKIFYLLAIICLVCSCSPSEQEKVINVAKGYMQKQHSTIKFTDISCTRAYAPYDTPKYFDMCETLTLLDEERTNACKARDSVNSLLKNGKIPANQIATAKQYIHSFEATNDTVVIRSVRYKANMDSYVRNTKKTAVGYFVKCKGTYTKEDGKEVDFEKILLVDTLQNQVLKTVNMKSPDFKMWVDMKRIYNM